MTELYVLDYSWYRKAIVDVFISLVWTERYNDVGDFVLVASDTPNNRLLLVEGAFLQIPQSEDTMQIETVSAKNGQLTMTGQSLLGIFKSRLYRAGWQNAQDSWQSTNMASTIINFIVNDAVGNLGGNMAANFVLPVGYGPNELLSPFAMTGAPTGPILAITVPYGTLFDAVKQIADSDALGFSMPLKSTTPTFKLYRGRDLTSSQSTYTPVIFESNAENITDLEELRSISGYATHAYAWASGMTAQSSIGVAVAPGASALTNWQRRSIYVDATDLNSADYTAAVLKSLLDQRAANALANNNYVRMLDGKIVPQTKYRYGYEYLLGDVLELRGSGTTSQKARVTEYIRSQDATGWHEYPTLSVIA